MSGSCSVAILSQRGIQCMFTQIFLEKSNTSHKIAWGKGDVSFLYVLYNVTEEFLCNFIIVTLFRAFLTYLKALLYLLVDR